MISVSDKRIGRESIVEQAARLFVLTKNMAGEPPTLRTIHKLGLTNLRTSLARNNKMDHVREVTLEFLRHGPAHNQLLSPLTQYLALCDNHGAVTVKIPLEHAQFLARLKPLSYELNAAGENGSRLRELQLQETAGTMQSILAQVPGLIAALAVAPRSSPLLPESKRSEHEFTHLELILSASELALLPFELANAPSGFPGAGKSLLLQSQSPLCLTRRVRRVDVDRIVWPHKPRVLFVAANPEGEIPLQAHVNELIRCLQPWIPDRNTDDLASVYREHLTILPQASIQAIEAEIAKGLDEESAGPYTHIHILAHGVEYAEGVDQRFGLALHQADDPTAMDRVSGLRLATALRTSGSSGGAVLALPTVVTLASCQSGQQGSVIGAGASVAHALHESGIPLVIASQFPLSFPGSIRMVEVLYHGLLRGHDPRVLLNKLRRDLASELSETHDWASIIAYASLPLDIEDQLQEVQISQARRRTTLAFDRYDRERADNFCNPERVQELRKRLTSAKVRLKRLQQEAVATDQASISGMLASIDTREAEIVYRESQNEAKKPGEQQSVTAAKSTAREVRQLLDSARRNYRAAFERDHSKIWGLVQSLAHTAALAGGEQLLLDDWNVARVLSEWAIRSDDKQAITLGHGNLVELYLLSLMMKSGGGVPEPAKARLLAIAHLEKLLTICQPTAFELKLKYWHLSRFANWFNEETLGRKLPKDVTKLANDLLELLPEDLRIAA